MFKIGSHASSTDVSRQIEVLKEDIVRLGEVLAHVAEDRSRGPRREAARYAERAWDAAEDHAHVLASSGITLAREGGRMAAERLARTAHRAERMVVDNPGRALLAAAAVGLTVGAVLFAFGDRSGRR